MRAPTAIVIGPGVSTEKFNHGGVIASRFNASAKNSKTLSRCRGTQHSVRNVSSLTSTALVKTIIRSGGANLRRG